ncbi:uncharacterized protein LOC128735467 [Sabethes cyaneus]|uniref:uncharacterized protein LOC128735467 n=1 Tax=Sabethes cyaneus TaxID=53552 RepID=UPI00237EB5F9|nr:uncharacterized protein LOC128735467 [Sabethes cyaneus]
MDIESTTKSLRPVPSFRLDQLIPRVWTDEVNGLRKELIDFSSFVSMKKPSDLSRCLVIISNISHFDDLASNILTATSPTNEQWISIGRSTTPVDYYVELLLMQMLTNEESKCFISCKTRSIEFNMKLIQIDDGGYYFQQTPEKLLNLARQYKENGVIMFPKYPLFAHRYFSRAAKCLLSCAPLEDLDPSREGVETIREMQLLLETLYLNISACLIKQNRYEDVLSVLEYHDQREKPSEKAVYRKALAQFHLKRFEQALQTLQRINYSGITECATLYEKIRIAWKEETNQYNSMVKKMFG